MFTTTTRWNPKKLNICVAALEWLVSSLVLKARSALTPQYHFHMMGTDGREPEERKKKNQDQTNYFTKIFGSECLLWDKRSMEWTLKITWWTRPWTTILMDFFSNINEHSPNMMRMKTAAPNPMRSCIRRRRHRARLRRMPAEDRKSSETELSDAERSSSSSKLAPRSLSRTTFSLIVLVTSRIWDFTLTRPRTQRELLKWKLGLWSRRRKKSWRFMERSWCQLSELTDLDLTEKSLTFTVRSKRLIQRNHLRVTVWMPVTISNSNFYWL